MRQAPEMIERFAQARILVIGDAMLDQFVFGDCTRISPEAPAPVFLVQNRKDFPGGACNVVRNLCALNAGVRFASVIGQDATGAKLGKLLEEVPGLDVKLLTSQEVQTTSKTRFIAGSQHVVRIDEEKVVPLSARDEARIVDLIGELAPQCDVIVLSDYAKGVLTTGVLKAAMQTAKAAGKRVIVDPKGRDYSRYAGAFVVTPNRKELAEATGRGCDTDEEVEAAGRQLIAGHGFYAVLATRGAAGMTLITSDAPAKHLPAKAREVYDVSGAGDTVVATLAAALAAGAPLFEAAQLANTAAGIVVNKVGTAVCHADELEMALHHLDLVEGEAKIVSLSAAARSASECRAEGKRVGFTNGCFDLLHPGHVSLLAQARAQCDRLIVGLNSDDSIRRLKGPSRPVQPEMARAIVLAGLSNVDKIVIFSQDTPLELIHAIRPDVLIKGSDYTVETVVGSDFVLSHGGSVFLAKQLSGFSTTSTISRMQRD